MGAAELRYMQISITPEAGGHLPGYALMESFSTAEFLSHIGTENGNMRCLVRLEYSNESAIEENHDSLEIIRIIEKSPTAALVEAIATGPLPRVFSALEHVWWVSPTYLSKEGFVLTIRGTASALRCARESLSNLIEGHYRMKLGTQTAHNPSFIDLLPEKQRGVLDQAIKMGYYDRPRRCTQRAIAEALDIKQATVSEHLQSAESTIIHAFANDH